MRLNRFIRIVFVAGLLAVLGVQLVHVAWVTSATWDEPHHLFDGYTVWKLRDYRLNAEVPPLVKMAAAVPLLGMNLRVPANHGWTVPKEAFLDGRAFVFGNGGDRVLFRARMACAVFTLGLGLLIYMAGAEMFGVGAGLFGLALLVFDPNLLAHGALVTTDVGSACFFLAAVFAFYRYCKAPSWPRLLLAALAAGLLLVAKFTGIFLLPMLVLSVLLEAGLARSWRVSFKRLGALLFIGMFAWVVIWAFYGFRYKAGPEGRELNPPLTDYLARMYDRKDARVLGYLAEHRVLPEAYIWGLENTKQTEFEDTSYFWGKVYRHGNWEYFPVAFLVKSTLPFLILLCLLPLGWKWGLRTRVRELGFLLIPVVVYFAISMHSDMDIGWRHLLPVYAFLYVLIGGVGGVLLRRNWRWSLLLVVLLGWQVVTSYRVAPAYMAYGNEAWGGPSQVHRYLSDANVDWGQQLKAVKTYLDARHIRDCWFAYFPDGAIEASDYGVPCKRLPTTSSLWWLDLPMNVPPAIDGPVLISDADLQGIEFGDGALNPYDGFRGLRPDAVIDQGVYVYNGRFAMPLASALYQAHEAGKLAAAGKVDEGLRMAESAAGLAPGSAVVQGSLGDLLLLAGRPDEALVHYEMGLKSAETVRPDLQGDLALELAGKIGKLKGR